jgi:hypothetical protein
MAQEKIPFHQAMDVTRIEAEPQKPVNLNIDNTRQTREILCMQYASFGH